MTGGITEEQRVALVGLRPVIDDATYLAGGVAIALELHHRFSIDLDLFVTHDFDPERLAERLAIAAPPGLRIVGRAEGTLHAEVAGVPVSLLSYRYPLLAPTRGLDVPIAVASLVDLGCMKLSAIAGGGAAKDFWDLQALLEHGVADGNLARLLDLYPRKFASEDIGHVVRALSYFGDADGRPLPRGLAPEAWERIKKDMTERVKAL